MTRREALLGRVRWAYRRGRAARALRTALAAVPLSLLSLVGCAAVGQSIVGGAILAAALFGLSYAGGAAGRAVPAGLVAGSATLVIPLVAGRLLEGTPLALAACVAAGLGSGVLVLRFARGTGRARFILAAGTVAVLVGSLGCLGVGLGGLAALSLGLAAVLPAGLLVRAA